MQPIVDGLQEEYGDQVSFISFNVKDNGDGATFFQSLSLPGHPSIVIFTPDGEEVYRRFGIVSFDDLDNTLLDIIED